MPPKDRGRYKLPVPLPKDMILKDTEGKVWRLGSQIGQGGFGLIYLASPQTHIPVEDDAVHVIKVEYLENGPLFSELKFYQRAAKLQHNCYRFLYLDVIMVPSDQKRQQNHIEFITCTLQSAQRERPALEHSYRFMVMERLGEDLQRIFEDCGGRFRKETVLQLGARILDTLEYIHENEYVHGDIKAANLLLGYTNPHEVYLADYGLSYRYCPNGNHKQYQENPRKGHNGTIKFTSLDAHKGVAEGCGFRKVLFGRSHLHTHLPVCYGFALVSQEMAGRSAWEREAPSRRGDLEILGYCMLQWLCGKLPWEQNLNDPVAVQTAKTKLMDELPHSVLEWDSSGSSCGEISKFLACVYGLAYDEKPKYEVLKKILLDGLESSGTRYDGPLEFSAAACTRNHCVAKASKRIRFFRPWFLAVEDTQGLVHFGAPALTLFADRQALPTASLHGTVCRYPGADSFHLGPLHSLSTSPFIHQALLPLKRQPKNSGSHYKQSTVSSLLAYEQKVTPDDLSDSTSTSLVRRKEVRLPKPMPKPVQQKQKKMESDEHVYQNQACMGVPGKQVHDEEKPSQLNRMVRQAEPQQVPLWKSSPKPVHQKQTTVKEDETNGLSRPRARLTRRPFQAEATPLQFHTMTQEPDHPPKKDTARELPPFDPQAIFSESKKTHNQLFTTDHHPLSSQEAGSGITPPLWSILRLAFTEQTYHYTIAIPLLLLLIVLSLYFL